MAEVISGQGKRVTSGCISRVYTALQMDNIHTCKCKHFSTFVNTICHHLYCTLADYEYEWIPCAIKLIYEEWKSLSLLGKCRYLCPFFFSLSPWIDDMMWSAELNCELWQRKLHLCQSGHSNFISETSFNYVSLKEKLFRNQLKLL